jgi:adenosylcobinamide kinase/adenosylcobinamide-phosphate guanylyltransferase
MPLLVLLGGARSGKSVLAVRLAQARSASVVMIATAEALDDEMAARIEQHRRERPDWETIEAPLELEAAIDSVPEETTAIIDCLTVWVSNLLLANADSERILARAAALADRVRMRAGLTIAVSNEVGMGIVPDNALARRYRDVLGSVNAAWAVAADDAHLLVAGRLLPLTSPESVIEGPW